MAANMAAETQVALYLDNYNSPTVLISRQNIGFWGQAIYSDQQLYSGMTLQCTNPRWPPGAILKYIQTYHCRHPMR